MALVREFASRAAAAAAARGSDAAMQRFVARIIDLGNLQSALALASQPCDIPPARLFVDGGSVITVGDLVAAHGASGAFDLETRLSQRIRGTPMHALMHPGEQPAEDAALLALADEFRRLARDAPLGLAPVILFVLQQRVELRTLLRIMWSVSLGVPPATVERRAGVGA